MAIENELIKGIELLKEGKEEGFNILYSHTYNYVYGRAKVIMKNEEDALDLTQETFVQAYKGILQLEDVNNIYAWLGSITYRQGMKMFRKRREILVGEEAEGIFEEVEDNDRDYHPESSADEKATAEIMKKMIEELPELQKATIMAYYYDNMKIDDIAEVFECSSNTVKSRLNYAKKTLKEKVEVHEKENRYKLHSLTPMVFILAYKSLFTEKEYMLAAESTQGIYNGVCANTGISTTSSTIVETGAITTEKSLGASMTSSSSVSTVGGAVATETVVKAGISLGVKILLGAAAVLTTGVVAVGGMGLGKQEENVELNSTEIQEIVQDDIVEGQEEEIVFESYAEVVSFIQSPEYRVDESEYSEDAVPLMRKFISTMILEKDMAFDMTELTEEQRKKLNYNLLNEAYSFSYDFIPSTSSDTIIGGPAGIYYNTEELNTYLDAFYEGGRVSKQETQYEQYTVYMPSDAWEYHSFDRYGMFQYGDYLLIEAACEYATTEYIYSIPVYKASMLFKITENEKYPVQMVHVTTFEKALPEHILLKEVAYSCHDIQNARYFIEVSNIRDYGDYQKFDMRIGLDSTQDMGRSIDFKEIFCYDAILEGNAVKFESTEEWYYPDYGYTDDKVEMNNDFYGEIIIQEDGSLYLTYDVKDNSDGWVLNKSEEVIHLK